MRIVSTLLVLCAALALVAQPARAGCDNPMKRDVMTRPGYVETPVPEALPDLGYVRADGSTGRLSDLKGAPTILSFWFPECPGCRMELPALDAMLADYKGRAGLNLVQLAIRGDADHIRRFLAREGLSHVEPNLDAGLEIFKTLCLAATPSHAVLDAQGRMVAAFVGPTPWTGPEAKAYLERLMAGG